MKHPDKVNAHSGKVKAMLLKTIDEISADPSKYAVNPGKDFTRNRKMGFNDIIMMLLTMEAGCVKEEIYRYFGRNTNAPSKTAFYRQRQKLNKEALSNLLCANNLSIPMPKDRPNTSPVPLIRTDDTADRWYADTGILIILLPRTGIIF